MAYIDIQAADGGSFKAYVAKPESGAGPGLVVIQEIFGVNKVMRDITDGLARQGYIAVCPDIFWRQEPGVDITDQTQEEWDKAFELYQGFDEDKGAEDLIQTLKAVRGIDGCTGKAGDIGFCLGGKLAYLIATRSDADCSVAYYGVGIANNLDEADNIKAPILLHVAEEDQFVSKDEQAKVRDRLSGNPLVTIHTYPGKDHAFARVGGEHYDKEAAKLANERTSEFLQKHLR